MDSAGNEQRVSWAAHDPVRSHLKGQLAFEHVERFVEGVMVKLRSGPAGPDEIFDDADRATCVAGAASVIWEVISGTDILHLLERPAADWAKIRATVQNAQEVLVVINSY
jgi:hypothetical protein